MTTKPRAPAPAVLVVPGISHLDHGLTRPQIEWLVEAVRSEWKWVPPVLVQTLAMPRELGTITCGLYGPSVPYAWTDDLAPLPPHNVHEVDVVYKRRGARTHASRMVDRPLWRTNEATVIVFFDHNHGYVLATAYGGPAAPREPFDASIQDDEAALRESHAFWRVHALSTAML